ncbi:SRPBCC family protein [Streptomyces sp. AJS327]|uniref:SRPBCC family protein n=1 Tax=Streptomyces sp. AJS327 TaxID=2545265 RepID=UPI0015DE73CC|nr:SRPBCC family protein [Streptomyces sp. AJS327]MBA0053322.1 SRPBCC family protein [Streptomyces sp. AJS327]
MTTLPYTPPPAIPPAIADVPGLLRWETTSREEAVAQAGEFTKDSFTYDEVYGRFCTIEEYIDAPPEAVFDYLRDERNLNEYTYSTRDFAPVPDKPGLFVGRDTLPDDNTKIYLRMETNRSALTVDMHCAWDQGDHLWMIYLYRIVDAQVVLNKPGSVVLWSNCRHPFYANNPFPETVPNPERPWVGDFWDLFYAGHALEMINLKKILEHRHGYGEWAAGKTGA